MRNRVCCLMALCVLLADAGIARCGFIYWTDSNNFNAGGGDISRADLDGSEKTVLIHPLNPASGIDLDLQHGLMYWPNFTNNGAIHDIRRANLDGSGQTILVRNLDEPADVRIDLRDGKIFWVERNLGSIDQANLDGTGRKTVLSTPDPEGLALDLSANKMYWTARIGTTPGQQLIRRANLDGSSPEILVRNLPEPAKIALDLPDGKMYWTDAPDPSHGDIRRANLDGSSPETLVQNLPAPIGIALDLTARKMYWADVAGGDIRSANLDGSDQQILVSGITNQPTGIAVAVPEPAPAFGMIIMIMAVGLFRWRHPQHQSLRPARRRLNLMPQRIHWTEVLEGRLLLSTYTVIHLNDSGRGSLRDAIEQTNSNPGADTITFARGLNGTVALGGAQLELSDDLTIDGPGPNVLDVSGNNASQVFRVDAKVTAAFIGLTISEGNGGGIINNGGRVTISNCTIAGNDANDPETNNTGGAISNSGSIIIVGSTISGNSAGIGAGIFNAGRLTLTNDTVSANTATGEQYGDGGGIYNDSAGTLTIANCAISGNSAIVAGGGVFNQGTLILVDSTVSGNRGGGISGGPVTTVVGTTISDNRGYGIEIDGTATFTDSTVAGNSGIGILGGGAVTIGASTVWGNSGDGISGGGALALANTTVADNGGWGIDSEFVTIANGTISRNGGGIGGNSERVNAFNSIIAANLQTDVGVPLSSQSSHNLIGGDPKLAILGDYGGPTLTMPPLAGSPAIDAGDDSLAKDAGGFGLHTDQRGRPRVVGVKVDIGAVEGTVKPSLPTSLVVNTLADDYGRFAAGHLSLREAIAIANYRRGPNLITFAAGLGGTITLTLGALSINDDLTIRGPGAQVLSVSGSDQSRVFGVASNDVVRIEDLTITGGYVFGGDGAGIANGGTLALSRCKISGNSAVVEFSGDSHEGGYGGAIANEGTLVIVDSTITNNSGVTAVDSGGSGALTIASSTVSDNTGGVNGVELSVINTTVSGNADFGIAVDGGPFRLANSTIVRNVNGIYLQNVGTVQIVNSVVAANDAAPGDYDIATDRPFDLSSSHNLIGIDYTGQFVGVNGNIVGVTDPELAPLGDYGGLTQTMPPLPGSPAIDAGSNALVPAGVIADQRGFYRVFNGTVDIGAVEYGSSPLAPGDANGDHRVDFTDLLILAQNYGSTTLTRAGDPVTFADGDFNGDGAVGFADLLVLAQNYGRSAKDMAISGHRSRRSVRG